MTPSEDTQVRERIAKLLAATLGANVTVQDLHGIERLDEVASFDSIALLEFTVALENEFGVRFDADQMKRDFVLNLPALQKLLGSR